MTSDDRDFRISKGLPDDELIQLSDLEFDFEDYFRRYHTPEMTEDEGEEFSARIYGMFCRDVYAAEEVNGMITIPSWAATYIADKLMQALGGVEWEEIMGLPWDDTTKYSYFNAIGSRAIAIWSAIEMQKNSEKKISTTTAIAEQAGKHNVSYECARGDYYEMRKAQAKQIPMPQRFLTKRYQS